MEGGGRDLLRETRSLEKPSRQEMEKTYLDLQSRRWWKDEGESVDGGGRLMSWRGLGRFWKSKSKNGDAKERPVVARVGRRERLPYVTRVWGKREGTRRPLSESERREVRPYFAQTIP